MRHHPAYSHLFPPVASFKVRPEGKSLYVEVVIFKTLIQMKSYCRIKTLDEYGEDDKGDFVAMCFKGPYFDDKGRLSPCLGQVVFALEDMGPETVGHELNHAALYWASRVGIDPMRDSGESPSPEDSDEERFVKAQDEMVRQFYQKIERFNFWD